MGDIMSRNLLTINRMSGTYGIKAEFDMIYEDDYFIVLDIEEIGQDIGRKVLDDNPNRNDICSEEIYAWIEGLTDELREKLYEEVDDYIYRNL